MADTLLMPQTLAQYALNLQRALPPPFLAAAGVLFILGAISLSLLRIKSRSEPELPFKEPDLQDTKWGPRRLKATYILLGLATAITLVVAYSTTLTLTALQFASNATSGGQTQFQVTRGTSVEVLQWFIFSLSTLFTFGVVRIIRAYNSETTAEPEPRRGPGFRPRSPFNGPRGGPGPRMPSRAQMTMRRD